jgi:hypothetical protein
VSTSPEFVLLVEDNVKMDAGFSLQDMARLLCYILQSRLENIGPLPREPPQASVCAQPHSDVAGAALFDIQRACWALGAVLQTVLASLSGVASDSRRGCSLAAQTMSHLDLRARPGSQQPSHSGVGIRAGAEHQCTCPYTAAAGCAGEHASSSQSSWRSWSLCLCSETACPHGCTSVVQADPSAQAWPWLLCACRDLARAKLALQDVGLCCESCAAWWSTGCTSADV